MTRFNYESNKYIGKQTEAALPYIEPIPGPHTNIKRAPVIIFTHAEKQKWIANSICKYGREFRLAA